jgi:hypothetical protein
MLLHKVLCQVARIAQSVVKEVEGRFRAWIARMVEKSTHSQIIPRPSIQSS